MYMSTKTVLHSSSFIFSLITALDIDSGELDTNWVNLNNASSSEFIKSLKQQYGVHKQSRTVILTAALFPFDKISFRHGENIESALRTLTNDHDDLHFIIPPPTRGYIAIKCLNNVSYLWLMKITSKWTCFGQRLTVTESIHKVCKTELVNDFLWLILKSTCRIGAK